MKNQTGKQFNIHKLLFISRNSKNSKIFEHDVHRLNPLTEVIKTQTARQGIEIMLDDKVEAVFVEYKKSPKGVSFFEELRRKSIYVPVIAIIEKGKELQAAEAIKDGAFDYIVKDTRYSGFLANALQRIQWLSMLDQEKEDELEQQSFLFKQIYKSQKWWQNIIDAITDYLFVIEENSRILRTNKAFANLFSMEPADIIMKPYYELFELDAPHEWCVLPKEKKDMNPRSVERKINGVDYLISSFPIFFDERDAAVYIMKDITETRRLKDQVYHLDKLSSLGTLTSGVAHEINNPLTGIIGYTEMLLMKNGEETTKKYLRNVYDSAIRCKRIVENMLTFSRQTQAQKSFENINDIIDKTVELHEYWLKSNNIEIVKNYTEVPYVAVDRQQMQQVILNLLINAEHAIANSERRGRIEFKTSHDDETKSAVIAVSDNGNGISREILPKIFDPFFTTKPVNMGTGLGLSIAHGIIAEQGGIIEAESTPGEGASFTIKLPHGR